MELPHELEIIKSNARYRNLQEAGGLDMHIKVVTRPELWPWSMYVHFSLEDFAITQSGRMYFRCSHTASSSSVSMSENNCTCWLRYCTDQDKLILDIGNNGAFTYIL